MKEIVKMTARLRFWKHKYSNFQSNWVLALEWEKKNE